MTLTAVYSDHPSKSVCAVGLADPRKEIKDWQKLVCPITGSRVFPVCRHDRRNQSVMAHFRRAENAEWPEDVIEDCEYWRSESAEHRQGKILVAEIAPAIDPGCTRSIVRFEHRIWIPGKGKYRIADVAFQDGDLTLVHEVQISPITVDELTDRTRDYFSANCDVQWHFGPAMQRENYRRWHIEFVGFPAAEISFG